MSTAIPQFVEMSPCYVVPTSGPYRVADYLDLPDEPRLELIQGRYHLSPAPITLHQIVSLQLTLALDKATSGADGLLLVAPCDVVLANDTVVQPDLLYFSKARRPKIGARLESPPDLVIEILSPSHHSRDRVLKLGVYAEAGVAEYWIVDPAERSIEFLVLTGDKYQVQPIPSPVYQSPTLQEVKLDLPAFWGEVDRQVQG